MWLILVLSSLVWLISVCAAGYVGYNFKRIQKKLTNMERRITELTERKQDTKAVIEAERPKSSLIDPYDMVQRAQFEQDELQRKLNR